MSKDISYCYVNRHNISSWICSWSLQSILFKHNKISPYQESTFMINLICHLVLDNLKLYYLCLIFELSLFNMSLCRCTLCVCVCLWVCMCVFYLLIYCWMIEDDCLIFLPLFRVPYLHYFSWYMLNKNGKTILLVILRYT